MNSTIIVLSTYTKKIGKRFRGRALIKCFCGNVKEVYKYDLESGKINSCGCMISKGVTTHGLSKHPLYAVFNTMLARCYNPLHDSYKWYGAKGISVSDEWKTSFVAFYNWAIQSWKPGLQIDRIDNSRGYSSTNCRFVTPIANSANRG